MTTAFADAPVSDHAATAAASAASAASAVSAAAASAATDASQNANADGSAAAGAGAATGEAPAVVVPAVPEKYDLKLPDGSTLDPAIVEKTAARARELGLSNEAGQKLLDQTVQDLTDAETANRSAYDALVEAWKPGGAEYVKRDETWRKEALADAEIGGSPEKLAASIEHAQKALTKYGPDLKTYLDQTGLGSHPAAIKFLATIGRAMAEGADGGGLVLGNGGGSTKPKTDAQTIYPDHYDDAGRPKPVAV